MVDYCKTAQVKTYLGVKAPKDDSLLDDLVTRVSRAFDLATGYTFGAVDESAITHYRWNGDVDSEGSLVFAEPFTSITSIVNGDGITMAATNYLLRPQRVPHTVAKLTPVATAAFTDGTDNTGIVVTGVVGYPLTDDIVQACVLWTAFMYRQKDNPLIALTAIQRAGIVETPGRPKYTTDTINSYRDMRPSG